MADTSTMNAEIRARARAQVADLNHDDIADSLPEQLSKVATVPAIFVMIRRSSAREDSPGIKKQSQELDVQVGIVVGSLAGMNAALKGAKSLEAVAGQVRRALHWFPVVAANGRKLKFRGEDDAVRDGSRIGIVQHYAMTIEETYA